MSNRNLFTGIVTHENDVTELLVNLMYLDDGFRASCLKKILKQLKTEDDKELVDDGIINGIEACNIYTQYHTKYGIPDIVIENEHCFFIIENKIRYNTDWTGKQIEQYPYILVKNENPLAKQTNDKRVKGIVFLVPEKYNMFCDTSVYQETGISWIKVYWNDLIKDMRANSKNCDETLIEEVINCFDNVIDKLESLEKITKDEIELLRNDQKLICETFKLKHLMLAWTSSFIESYDFIFGDISDAWYGIGYYFKLNDQSDDEFYIGLSPNTMSRSNFCSICYLSKSFKDGGDFDSVKNGWWIYFPIYEDCIKTLCNTKEGFDDFFEKAKSALQRACKDRYGKELDLPVNKEYNFDKDKYFKLNDFAEVNVLSNSNVCDTLRLSDKVLAYVKKFVMHTEDYDRLSSRRDFQGIGYNFYYKKKWFFLGVSPVNKNALDCNRNNISLYFGPDDSYTYIENPFGDDEDIQYETFKNNVLKKIQEKISNC